MSTNKFIEASAPGKVILLGEYAVLEGAPSIVMAVSRRAMITVTREVEVNRLIAPQISETPLVFTMTDAGKVLWHGVDDATGFRLALLSYLIERFAPGAGVEIVSDTAAFYEEGIKLGFGSSAAVTVAAASALAGEELDLDTMVEAHRAIQDGHGSGFDVAASRTGGVSRYRSLPRPVTESVTLPEDLILRCVWTGSAASTTGFLRGLDTLGPRLSALDALCGAAERTIASLGPDAASWVAAVEEYAVALRKFSHETTLPIFAGGHNEVMDIAKVHGVAYKPSGAGGGDIGIALSNDPAAMKAFVEDIRSGSMRIVRAGLDPVGLQMTSA